MAPAAAASERSETSRGAWGWGPTRIECGAPRALNKVRQAAITREIIEVVSGAEAL
ncbi:MAG: hypothetical protein DMF85_20000 [Acidobacteria bacterium]|nr:MAG: hypothetical protein DMF85_20000 [Acidobacteriota bacterium]